MSEPWRLRLADRVELDLQDIVAWTAEKFGPRQAEQYIETVTQAIEALCDGPSTLGARVRDDIGPGIYTLHVARRGRKGRHFVVFKVSAAQTLDVLRLLHDSMDLEKHLPPPNDNPH